MKKILLLVTACMLLSLQGFAQFGVKAGLNFNSLGELENTSSFIPGIEKKTGFHAGVLYRFRVPVIGLAIQPELVYSQVKGELDLLSHAVPSAINYGKSNISVSYLQLPVALQMGLDLVLLRPYIQVVPYVGCTLGSNVSTKNGKSEMDIELVKPKNLKLDTEKFNYGIGIGAGLDIWRLQISGRYNWDLGKIADYKWEGVETFEGGKSKGFQLSVALFF